MSYKNKNINEPSHCKSYKKQFQAKNSQGKDKHLSKNGFSILGKQCQSQQIIYENAVREYKIIDLRIKGENKQKDSPISKPSTPTRKINNGSKNKAKNSIKEQQNQSKLQKLLRQSQRIITERYQEQTGSVNPQQIQEWIDKFLLQLKQKKPKEIKRKQQKKQEKLKEKEKVYNHYEDQQYSKFFNANILQDEEYQQQFLYNIATRYCGQISSTKLIYIWSPLHKSNIHEYIDNKPNLLFLVKTEEESILAAYTEMPFKRPFPDVGFGALISLTNRRVFGVKKNQRAISYDGTYVAFGNYELLIKGNEISSNLGNAGGYYQSNGEKARIFFNDGSKSATKIAELQVFQIFT